MSTKDTQSAEQPKTERVVVTPPNFKWATFWIEFDVLVQHRFSQKTKMMLLQKMVTGKASASKKNREPQNIDVLFNDARYIHKDGWDGINAPSFRKAMISACRLVSYKMTLAKLSIFIEADGKDKDEPQIPLVRIYGKPTLQTDMARVDNGNPYVTVRPAYHNARVKLNVKWDGDQFTLQDVTNLLSRVGQQVGIGEGRPDSKDSCGMGWGTFRMLNEEEIAEMEGRKGKKAA